MTENEGYIKFKAHWTNAEFPILPSQIDEINDIRTILIKKHWLGVLPGGIGFGNISFRMGASELFIITGSATGEFPELKMENFALVEKFNLAKNQLWCKGKTIASSESLTHAVFYQFNPKINAVVHIHSKQLWLKHLDKLPTSDKNANYGTPEMARSISNLFIQTNHSSGVFVMGGHEDGIIAFGQNFNQILNLLNQL